MTCIREHPCGGLHLNCLTTADPDLCYSATALHRKMYAISDHDLASSVAESTRGFSTTSPYSGDRVIRYYLVLVCGAIVLVVFRGSPSAALGAPYPPPPSRNRLPFAPHPPDTSFARSWPAGHGAGFETSPEQPTACATLPRNEVETFDLGRSGGLAPSRRCCRGQGRRTAPWVQGLSCLVSFTRG